MNKKKLKVFSTELDDPFGVVGEIHRNIFLWVVAIIARFHAVSPVKGLIKVLSGGGASSV